MNTIEKLSRMRSRIIWFVLIGTGTAAVLLLSPFFFPALRTRWLTWNRSSWPVFHYALGIWALTLVVFGVLYALYKRRLRKDPASGLAVDDERVRANWLRAYRTAFFTVFALASLSKLFDIFWSFHLVERFMLPDRLWIILAGAVLSLVGSFLYFSREPHDE